ncbi:MAG: DNA polymerase [Lachnospiraceae bacterium]|nr:DNA polymerase [bacterium]MDY5518464.1 DNA polymerase [Lachnospiraceae bacterium]
MNHLSIDIETRSDVDIGSAGAYRYAQSEDFEILLFAYMADDEEVKIVDLKQGERIPEGIVCALQDPDVIKHAYNAAFEWYCLNRAGYQTPIEQWQCTMIHGLYCGYTAGLEATGKAIGLPQDKQKLTVGKALIRYFCCPQKATKSNGGRKYNDPVHDLDKWNLFKEYCKQDVVTENEIGKRVSLFPVPDSEWNLWRLDVKMNAFGVRVDRQLIDGALYIAAESEARLTEEAQAITGLDNPNSTAQLLKWLNDRLEVEVPDVRKETVADLLNMDIPADVRRVLEIRQQLGKTSLKKYDTMAIAMGEGDRIRGISQFYGANRTGRWAGRLVQLQNLPRNYLETIDEARRLTIAKNYTGLKAVYGDVPDTLSQLIRTAFIPSEGRKFVVADFSAIEARVIAWLAGETWVNEVFATTGKIYEATASQMFGVPIDLIKKGNPEYALRQKGKVATLALGYQGGTGSLIAMNALKMGLTEEELPDIVSRWRQSNPRIVDLWYSIEKAAVAAVQTCQQTSTHGLIFSMESDLVYGQSFLTVLLPAGRKLFYPRAYLDMNRFDKLAIHYYTVGQQSRRWEVTSTYGGKLTENIVQAIARDCLAEVLRRLADRGLDFVFHVHDEVIVDAPQELTVENLCALMAEPIPWAPGLILKGAGFEGNYYKKD